MKLNQELIIVNVNDSIDRESVVEDSNVKTYIWNKCISDEFPIIDMEIDDNMATCQIGKPHLGFTMSAQTFDKKLHGKARIVDPTGIIWADFLFVEGKATGKCKLYYESGSLFYEGYLKDGFRNGRGTEYDKIGNVIFDGFFHNGLRIDNISKNMDHRNYWDEVDPNGNLISMCKKNDQGLNNGICYFYKANDICCISKWENGTEVEILHTFSDHIMTSYRHMRKVYVGKYKEVNDLYFFPTGRKYLMFLFLDSYGGSIKLCCFDIFRLLVTRTLCSCDFYFSIICLIIAFRAYDEDNLLLWAFSFLIGLGTLILLLLFLISSSIPFSTFLWISFNC